MFKRIFQRDPVTKRTSQSDRPASKDKDREEQPKPQTVPGSQRGALSVDKVLQLQRTIGNRAVCQLIKNLPQRSLKASVRSNRIQRSTTIPVAGGAFVTNTNTNVLNDISSDPHSLIYVPMKGLFDPKEP